ncbi:hypothetical protein CIB48_g8163 [Xylaria polymorpha]|nr:hypothetical protein CIB48_g8163 [Xylaria polymorpha]
MRDRQARGKNPYDGESDDSDFGSGQGGGNSSRDAGSGSSAAAAAATNVGPERTGAPNNKERFAIHERRRMAAQVLGSTELLMMAAVRDDESIPATRLKYSKILCGLEEGSGNGGAHINAWGAAATKTTDKQRKRLNVDKGSSVSSGDS